MSDKTSVRLKDHHSIVAKALFERGRRVREELNRCARAIDETLIEFAQKYEVPNENLQFEFRGDEVWITSQPQSNKEDA